MFVPLLIPFVVPALGGPHKHVLLPGLQVIQRNGAGVEVDVSEFLQFLRRVEMRVKVILVVEDWTVVLEVQVKQRNPIFSSVVGEIQGLGT